MQITCKAPVNIAVIKYWGKRHVALNLPTNGSISVTIDMDSMASVTSITSDASIPEDSIVLNGQCIPLNPKFVAVLTTARKWARVRDARKRIKESSESPHQQPANPDHCLRIESKNNFPTAAGLASSASGFACLAFGLAMLFHLDLAWTMEELSVLARIGSGSACRSFFPGFVEWRDDRKGESVESVDDEEYFALDCCARQLNYSFESMQILILVLESKEKKVASTRGMQRTVETSTLFAERIHRVVPDRLDAMKRALEGSDFPAFAEITMKDSNQFHATCLDTFPPIHYLTGASHEIMDLVHSFCDGGGGGACYTFDAGPNAVLMFPDSETMEAFVDFAGIKSDTVSSPLASLKSKILDGSVVVVGPKVKMVIHAQVSKTGPIIV